MRLMRKTGRFVIPVLMIVVIGFIANSTINQHYHRLACGILVKHSHPFEHITNIGSWISLVFFLLLILIFTGQRIMLAFPVFRKKSGYYFTYNYRAPPLSFL